MIPMVDILGRFKNHFGDFPNGEHWEIVQAHKYQQTTTQTLVSRCNYQSSKEATGPLNRRKLLKFLESYAAEQADMPEVCDTDNQLTFANMIAIIMTLNEEILKCSHK